MIAFVLGAGIALLAVLVVEPLLGSERPSQVPAIELGRDDRPGPRGERRKEPRAKPKGDTGSAVPQQPASPATGGSQQPSFAPAPRPNPRPEPVAKPPAVAPAPPAPSDDDEDDDDAGSDDSDD